MIIAPHFYEGHAAEDIFSRLLTERIVLLVNEVNDDLAATIISQLLYLESVDQGYSDVHLLPGRKRLRRSRHL